MENLREAKRWLERAKSAMLKVKAAERVEGVMYEDLCLDLFQVSERALVAYFLYLNQGIPPVRSLGGMLDLLASRGFALPDWLSDVVKLDQYGLVTREEFFKHSVNKMEYVVMRELSEMLLEWVEGELEQHNIGQ